MLTSIVPLVLAAVAPQGYVKRETRQVDFGAAEDRFRLHAALVSDVATTAEPECVFSGNGAYELFSNGASTWKKNFDFALDEARFLSDGSVVGVAYSESKARDQEALRIVMIIPSGVLRIDRRLTVDALGRDPWTCMDRLRGWSVDEAQRRLVAWYWVRGQVREEWLAWNLDTGGVIVWKPTLDTGGAPYCCAALVPVPGTELALVHAWVRGERLALHRSMYALVDRGGKCVWTQRVDTDHVEGEVGRPAPGANGIVAVAGGEKPSFRVRSFADKKELAFEITRDPVTKAWSVLERE